MCASRNVEGVTMSKKERRPEQAQAAPVAPSRWPTIVVWAMMAVFVGAYLTACLVKYRYYLYNDFDMAMDANTAHMLMHGTLYNSVIGVNYLGNHMRLLMAPIALVYGLAPSCVTLIVIQTVGIALGALPVFWLARREIKNSFVAVAAAALYLLYPANGYVSLYQFHPEALTITTLLFTFWFLWTGRWGWMAFFAVLSVLAKEDVAVAVLAMACYALVIKRPKRWVPAAILGGIAVVSLVISFGIVMPRLNQGKVGLEKIYAKWGPSTGQALVGMATQPVLATQEIFMSHPDYSGALGADEVAQREGVAEWDTKLKQQYWLHMMLPVLFLALLSPLTLALALPAVAQHLLSSRVTEHTIVYHYTTHVTPFIILAAVLGLRNIGRLFTLGSAGGLEAAMKADSPARTTLFALAGAAVIAAVTSNGLFGPLFGVGILQEYPISERTWPTAVDRAVVSGMDGLTAEVPANVPVAADFRFLPRLVNRAEIHSLHHIYCGNYTLTKEPYPVPTNIEAVVVETTDSRFASFVREDSGPRTQKFLADNRLECADASASSVLWLRNVKSPVTIFEFNPPTPKVRRRVDYAERIALLGFDDVPAEVSRGEKAPLRTTWCLIRRPAPLEWRVRWTVNFLFVDDQGNEVFHEEAPLGYCVWPASDWGSRSARQTFWLVVPPEVKPGTYTLCVQLCRPGREGLEPLPTSDRDVTRNYWRVPMGRVTVK